MRELFCRYLPVKHRTKYMPHVFSWIIVYNHRRSRLFELPRWSIFILSGGLHILRGWLISSIRWGCSVYELRRGLLPTEHGFNVLHELHCGYVLVYRRADYRHLRFV